ncbi:MAG: 4-hydroxy-3-methylbut-2-enyl diphosphate reductase [Candidatus Gastranaerophilales bacterium]|nr:4-hydroxy-3-methylbut-2-enyl diphosphate reductase [Candidatus Gastranaerophilales bacterium]
MQAKSAGFCYGVRRAVELSKEIKKNNPDKNVYILGELIHNAQAIQMLEELGIKTVNEIPHDKNGICIIRTHGVTPDIIKQIQNSGCEMIDATCPDVKKVQQKASELALEDYQVIIIGKAEHPEVIGIKAHADSQNKLEAIVISSPDEVKIFKDTIKSSKKVGIVVQTTQKIELLNKVLTEITPFSKEVIVRNTICPATKNRQKEAVELAQNAELMIVAGGKNSANTTHLAEILTEITKTVHIETADELDEYKNLLETCQNVGITAGASTPKEIIDEIIQKIGENK